MANKVSTNNEIYLNGVYYPVTRPVQSVLASLYPAKVVIGDTSKDSQIRSSVVAWSDWRGGIGIERMEGAGETDRAWWSTCQLRHKNHLVLPAKDNVTTTPSLTGLSGPTVGAIGSLGEYVYAAWNGNDSESPKLHKYSFVSETWTLLTTAGLVDKVTDSINYTDRAGTTFLVFAHYDDNGSGYTYSSNGSTWSSDVQPTKYLTEWDERLWGISNTGQLWYISAVLNTSAGVQTNTEILDAKLPLPDGYVTRLFVARDASGEPIIYASTKKGLWAHDAANSRFVETQLGMPFHPQGGKGAVRWRDSVYIPSGLTVYKYANGSNTAVVSTVGPDKDDGVPKDQRGSILAMEATQNELIATIDARHAPLQLSGNSIPFVWRQSQGTGSHVINETSGKSSIVGYNELGWEVKWVAGTDGLGIDAMDINDIGTEGSDTQDFKDYRIWWGFNGDVYYMLTPSNIINPSHLHNYEYDNTSTHETPWFNAGQGEVDKLALKLKMDIRNVDADIEATLGTEAGRYIADDHATCKREVAVYWAKDYDDTWYDFYTSAGAVESSSITTNGVKEFTFRTSAADPVPVGVSFNAIKFKIVLNRTVGADSSTEDYLKNFTPDVVSTTFEYRKKLDSKWGHQVNVDLSRPYKGNTPKQLRASLISAIESKTLVEFTFRDDDSADRNYYVDVVSATGLESTGYDERGNSTISLMEP